MKESFQLDLEQSVNAPKKPTGWGVRHTLAFLGFWAFGISYAMRFNLSIAIVAMAGTKQNHGGNVDSTFEGPKPGVACENLLNETLALAAMNSHNHDGPVVIDRPEFDWDEQQKGIILGSFFWGYFLTQLPGGILSDKYGGKWPLGIGLLITAIFAILTPWAARTHVYLLMFCRVIQGFGEGVTTPAMHEMLASWAPPDERSKIASFVYAGSQFGTAVIMIVSGYLIHGGVMGGWPSVFYLTGIFSLIWFVLWVFFIYDKPQDHPRISKEELHYLEKSIGRNHDGPKIPTPWLAIFTSGPVWAIIVGHVGHAYGLYLLLTQLPSYFKSVLHFDIKSNSWLSALPYILMWMTSMIIPPLADTLISKKILRIVTVRKCSQAIAHIGSALALIAAAYSGCDRTIAVTLITLSVGINGVIYSGYVVNHVDLAPNHAGILMGITNTFANLTGFIAPWLCGVILSQGNGNLLENWQYVFFISAAIYIVDVIFYALFASSTEQKWNKGK